MRKTSRILGIIGSCLALIIGGLLLLGELVFSSAPSYDYFYFDRYNQYDTLNASAADDILPRETRFEGDVLMLVVGGASVLGGVLGVFGSIWVKKRHVLAGVLMIIAAILSIYATVTMVLFILAAVFALRKEKTPLPPMMYAAAPPGWPAFPPPGAYSAYYPPGVYPPPGTYPQQGPYPPPGAYPPPGQQAWPYPWPPPAPAAPPNPMAAPPPVESVNKIEEDS